MKAHATIHRSDEERTDFIVYFADEADQAIVIEVPVRYATHWTELDDHYEIIAECAYAVAHALGIDLEDKHMYKISHPHGGVNFTSLY